MRAAGDEPSKALAAAREAATMLGVDATDPIVLHDSNNVVVRFGSAVVKVGTIEFGALEREHGAAAFGAANGAPVLAPIAELTVVEEFVVTAWPYVESSAGPPDERRVAAALAAFHERMVNVPVELPTLADMLREVAGVARDTEIAAAIPTDDDRERLSHVLDAGCALDDPALRVVVHGEPHDGNVLTVADELWLIDLENVKRAPPEWDLAFRPNEAVDHFPSADRSLVGQLRLVVSALVSTACWRHVTARPDDDFMRWHAEHHLGIIRSAG